jgi:hypothetical protein
MKRLQRCANLEAGMTREEKIQKIREMCLATNRDLEAGQPVRLRHIVNAFYVKKLKYRIVDAGHFLDPVSLTTTTAKWGAFKNDLTLQDDPCIDFLHQVLTGGTDKV